MGLVATQSPIQVIYCNETSEPFKYMIFKEFPVSLEVAPTFTTSGDLLIKVTDPNLEHKSWTVENLGAFKNTNVTIKMGKDVVKVTSLQETGAGT
ncbi:hypothetical protein KEJ28_00870, partial [Candidatus Bathyarchaeota archaeon]|nr:hypothetical protein [Candidatus Bathyarchaeota archaeon]